MRCCFITLGCRVNQYESDAMAELLLNAGHEVVDDPSIADVCVVNTCTVTNIADRKSRQMLSKAHRLNENAKVIATGCFTQRNSESVSKIEGVDAVMGSGERSRIVEIAEALFNGGEKKILVGDVMHKHDFEELSATHEGRTRAYLKIQDGCNLFCTYCAIPFARGAIRSRSLESVRKEAVKLDQGGYAEVVLTGIHLMSYGKDFGDGTNILDAVKCFDGLRNIKRIRFGSLEPHMLTDDIIDDLAKNDRVCKQFHLSLQSGSDTVLERMRRGYTSEQYFELCKKLRNAFGEDTAITTDIIAGFPGETMYEHEQTAEFMKKVGFAKVHIFPYSRRSGTKADAMPGQLSNAEKSRRAKLLIEEGKKLERNYLGGYLGRTVSVLVERCDETDCGPISSGCTDTYVKVKLKGQFIPNTMVSAKINNIMEEKDGELYLL